MPESRSLEVHLEGRCRDLLEHYRAQGGRLDPRSTFAYSRDSWRPTSGRRDSVSRRSERQERPSPDHDSQGSSVARERFTIAHEIAHVLAGMVMTTSRSGGTGADLRRESVMNAFAGVLLVPWWQISRAEFPFSVDEFLSLLAAPRFRSRLLPDVSSQPGGREGVGARACSADTESTYRSETSSPNRRLHQPFLVSATKLEGGEVGLCSVVYSYHKLERGETCTTRDSVRLKLFDPLATPKYRWCSKASRFSIKSWVALTTRLCWPCFVRSSRCAR